MNEISKKSTDHVEAPSVELRLSLSKHSNHSNHSTKSGYRSLSMGLLCIILLFDVSKSSSHSDTTIVRILSQILWDDSISQPPSPHVIFLLSKMHQ
jgi:hypothetical protein